jgi:hypothetical protein
VGIFPTASIPTTGNVVDVSVASSKVLLHDSGKISANLVTAGSALAQFALSVGNSASGKSLATITPNANTAFVLHSGGAAANPVWSAIATGDLPAIPLSGLATQAVDTVVANASGSTAAPTAVAVGSCSAASSALTYNTTTHAFGCNTISGSGTVNSGTANHLAYYASSTTAVSDMGADLTFNTHTMTGGASFVFDLTALTGSNVKFPASVSFTTPILGTPTSVTLTNATGLPTAGISDLGTGVGTFLTTPTSANLAAAITNETGSGAAVFGTSPTLATPSITTQAIDCHVACSPTAAQLSNAIVANITGSTGQANSAVVITGPTVAAGMNFVMILGAAEGAAATWTYTSTTANVYLDGGTVKTSVGFGNSAGIGSSISCFSFPISGAFALKCTTLSGTSTSS